MIPERRLFGDSLAPEAEVSDIAVRLATAADAGEIAQLARECYGETYPDRAALDPAHIAALISRRHVAYAVATTRDGRHAGQVALEPRGCHGAFEHGRAVVDTPFRGRGLMAAMSEVLFRDFAPGAGVRMVTGRSVTNHLFTQRYNFAAGFKPLGLLLGALKEGFSAAGIGESPEPVSILLMGLLLEPEPRPRRLALEGEDRRRCEEVLASLDIPVRRWRGRRGGPPLGVSVQIVESMGLTHVRLSPALEARRPVEDVVEGEAAHEACRLAWVDVPVEHGSASGTIEALRARGFGHAALIPLGGPAGEDVLRLQRLHEPRPLSPERIQLLPAAAALLEDVLSDVGALALA